MSSLSESKNNFDPCRVAIVGLGTVGGGVAEVLWHHGKADDNAVQLAGILEKNQENPKKNQYKPQKKIRKTSFSVFFL